LSFLDLRFSFFNQNPPFTIRFFSLQDGHCLYANMRCFVHTTKLSFALSFF
jgi:hypothetical protein